MKVLQALQRMKTHVVMTTPEATLSDAVNRMDLYQVDGLPVVNADGQLIGILTEADIVNALWKEHSALDLGLATAPVANYMTSRVVCVSESEDLATAAELMFQHGFKRLPVIDDQHQVVGTLNRVDVLQALLEGGG